MSGVVEGQPDIATMIANLVTQYVDEQFGELDARIERLYTTVVAWAPVVEMYQRDVPTLQATVGGLRDAVAELQSTESMPETVYRNFIKSEAERLRLVKPRVERQGTGVYGGDQG